MKNLKFGSLITLFAIALFIFSCGSDTGNQEGDMETTTETQATTETQETSQAVDKTGKEYTSTYVCPMHCKGSGSDMKGTCPVCGMDYVASADLKEVTGEDEDEEGHEGHNH